ncbi:MAG: hypothetical protein IJ083_17625 [Clostridia bacterium]|nr:hypothetical protein [Clostridia bacterium]
MLALIIGILLISLFFSRGSRLFGGGFFPFFSSFRHPMGGLFGGMHGPMHGPDGPHHGPRGPMGRPMGGPHGPMGGHGRF